jgi:hypothetical protein
MSGNAMRIETTGSAQEPRQARRSYHAPDLNKGPVLTAVTASFRTSAATTG